MFDPSLIARLRQALTTVGVWLIALLLLFEEWGWERLAGIVAWFGRLPGLRWIEARIKALPPYGALGIFIVPILTLLPVKLLALYWLGHGHTMLGIGVIIAAKLGGTAITARLFMLTQPTLMQLPWFARLFAKWMAFKDRILAQVKSSLAWRRMASLKNTIKAISKAFSDRLKRLLRR